MSLKNCNTTDKNFRVVGTQEDIVEMSNIRGAIKSSTRSSISASSKSIWEEKKFLGLYSGYSWYGLARIPSYRVLPEASTNLLSYLIVPACKIICGHWSLSAARHEPAAVSRRLREFFRILLLRDDC